MDSLIALTGSLGEAVVVVIAASIALSLRPLRCVGADGPPWIWVVTWAAMPLVWCLDRLAGNPTVPVVSLAPLAVLLGGWPLTVVIMLPVAALAGFAGQLDPAEAIHRLVWLGLVPATLALVLGAASRRWLPRHLFVYILARGFFCTVLALVVAGMVELAVAPHGPVASGDRLIAMWLVAFGEATVSGMLIAALVAFRPHQLATYTDRLYLPR